MLIEYEQQHEATLALPPPEQPRDAAAGQQGEAGACGEGEEESGEFAPAYCWSTPHGFGGAY